MLSEATWEHDCMLCIHTFSCHAVNDGYAFASRPKFLTLALYICFHGVALYSSINAGSSPGQHRLGLIMSVIITLLSDQIRACVQMFKCEASYRRSIIYERQIMDIERYNIVHVRACSSESASALFRTGVMIGFQRHDSCHDSSP